MMVNPPLRMPAPPAPEIALPMMNITEDCAAPQMRDPASNITKALMKVIWEQSVSKDLSLDLAMVYEPWSYSIDKLFRKGVAGRNYSSLSIYQNEAPDRCCNLPGKKVCAAIPAYVIQRVEGVGNCGNGLVI